MDQKKEFISEFCMWASDNGLPKNRRARLSAALQKTIEVKLPERDKNCELVVRPLDNSDELSCSYETAEIWLCRNSKGQLLSGVVAPDWATDWKRVSRDEEIEHIISDFFHLSAQYVARSRVASLVGAIALTYDRACEYRYAGLSKFRVGPETCFPSATVARTDCLRDGENKSTPEGNKNSRKQREFTSWVRTINGLDPYIHRAIYQYWKAIGLYEAHFEEEAITALDGITSIAAQFVQERLKVGSRPRQSVISSLGLSAKDGKALNHLYNLRCEFGAHPSRSKWWDFAEMYDDDFDSLRDTAKRLLQRLCQAELNNRTVDPFPVNWSDWFLQNALMVLNAVWFLNIR